jgi:8-oxo-dGTP pyrophosphatase MutT (NUDIX family)
MNRQENPEVISAGGVLISGDRKILFCHPTGSRWSNWRMPKGQVNPGESTKAAAIREVLEETGYTCNVRKLLVTEVQYQTSNRARAVVMKRLVMYLMQPIEQVQKPDWEHDEFKWISFDKIKEYAAQRELPMIEEAIALFETLEQAARLQKAAKKK